MVRVLLCEWSLNRKLGLMLFVGTCEDSTFSGKEIQLLASVNSWPQPVSPSFKVGFSLLAMRVVGKKNTMLGILVSVSSFG